ncbi:CBS domain-containing protein [Streptomonospora wellingtoniae]|uniref:CBS domain-containing protein n=1 Tax=Streptomonospora wellingtoniae TaxID=3075544 RepID=A0ABU2KTP1_9ACTN|nr:CBS domain-containing protein [Streptomonospora sp. DSM 45055]MDT0302542.1 CBS domain-containing protein [Streptomonospora sp. DSM 45055]
MAEQVREIMTQPPYTVSPQTTLYETAVIMRDKGIGDVVVTENDTVLGVLTDRDIVVRCVADGTDCGTATAGGALSGRLSVVGPGDSIDEAVRVMREGAVRRLPVVDADRVVGVVSLGDLAEERDPSSVLASISRSRANI